MNFDFAAFLEFPGILILIGLVLLIIAIILGILSAKKPKQKEEVNKEEIQPVQETSTPVVENPVNTSVVNSDLIPSEPVIQPSVVNNTPVVQAPVEPILQQPQVQEAAPIKEELPLNNISEEIEINEAIKIDDNILKPIEETTIIDVPVSNNIPNQTSAYGGYDPLGNVNLTFNQENRPLYGDANFKPAFEPYQPTPASTNNTVEEIPFEKVNQEEELELL